MKAECKVRPASLAQAIGLGLLTAAVVQELRKPAGERAWHGRLWGRIPYELRPPTFDRFRAAYWAPEDTHLFTDTPLGVGWSLNMGRLMRVCSGSRMKAGGGNGPQARRERWTSAM